MSPAACFHNHFSAIVKTLPMVCLQLYSRTPAPALQHDAAPGGGGDARAGVELQLGRLPGLHLQHAAGPRPGPAPGLSRAHVQACSG